MTDRPGNKIRTAERNVYRLKATNADVTALSCTTRNRVKRMQLQSGLIVAVVDGEILHLYRNTGNEAAPKLTAMSDADLQVENSGSGSRHQSSGSSPDGGRQGEDDFAAAVAAHLNKQVLEGHIKDLFIVATPKTLGELRRHYHKRLEGALVGELPKDLTGHSVAEIEAALAKV